MQSRLQSLASERSQLTQAQAILESESAANHRLSAELAGESESLGKQRRGLDAREAGLQDKVDACDRAIKVTLLKAKGCLSTMHVTIVHEVNTCAVSHHGRKTNLGPAVPLLPMSHNKNFSPCCFPLSCHHGRRFLGFWVTQHKLSGLQAAQEGSERAAQGQHALDVREAQMAQHESDMKDLKHALQKQHSDLQHKQQQLQVHFNIISCHSCCMLKDAAHYR